MLLVQLTETDDGIP
jgi:hypothetical protein